MKLSTSVDKHRRWHQRFQDLRNEITNVRRSSSTSRRKTSTRGQVQRRPKHGAFLTKPREQARAELLNGVRA